jgi:3-oxoacyl-(acyl-carrier-protein) synthase
MVRRRIAVTGLGCVSPVGNTVGESWDNLLAGKPGIDFITQFDAANFACKFAGEVKGFNIADYIPEKEARHMDRFIHLGWRRLSRRWPIAACRRATRSRPNWRNASAATSARASAACR